jgi:GNAT superfamily N-acetyltransferase
MLDADSVTKPIRVLADSELLAAVVQLAASQKSRLGFLPDEAFTQRALRGRLYAVPAMPFGVAAYVLFDVTSTGIAIRHLCVDVSSRGAGLARSLIEAVAVAYPDASCMRLLCRRDYGLDRFWTNLGFTPEGERPGRGAQSEPLTYWKRSFGQPTLLDWRPSQRFAIALDTNVFRDLHEDRSTSPPTRAALADWIFDVAELVISDEVLADLNREPRGSVRASLRAASHGYRRLTHATSDVETIGKAIESELRRRGIAHPGDSDIAHIARASAAGVESLLTRDTRLLETVGPVAAAIAHVRLLPPEDIALRLDEYQQTEEYSTASVAGTSVSKRRLRAGELDILAPAFLDRPRGETSAGYRATVTKARRDGGMADLVESDAGQPLALVLWRRHEQLIDVPIFRVAGHRLARTVAQQLCADLRAASLESEAVGIVRVSEDFVSSHVATALASEGFLPIQGQWIAAAARGIVRPDEVSARLSEAITGRLPDEELRPLVTEVDRPDCSVATGVARLETLLFPLKVAPSPMSCVLIPIRPTFASDLFDDALSAESLFKRPTGLGLEREHVYYSGATFPKSLTAPARILWYVSADRNRRLPGGVRACSHLREAVTDEPRKLTQQFRRLGVLDRRQIESMSGGRAATALRFTTTELFPTPVPLASLRHIFKSVGQILNLQWPNQISEESFMSVYGAGNP